jgi:serine/threonine protein kinase
MITPGKKLGPYEIGVPLGAGSMGKVYRARDTRLNPITPGWLAILALGLLQVARCSLAIDGRQPFAIAPHGNAGETDLSVDHSRPRGGFRALQHLV